MQSIKWIEPNTAIVNGGGSVEFAGLIRGNGYPVIRYIAPSVEEAVKGLVLEDWIFVVRKHGKTVLTNRKAR